MRHFYKKFKNYILYFTIFFILIVIISSMLFVLRRNKKNNIESKVYKLSISEVQHKFAHTYILNESIINRESNKDFEEVNAYFDTIYKNLNILLKGNRIKKINPISQKEIRDKIIKLKTEISDFEILVEKTNETLSVSEDSIKSVHSEYYHFYIKIDTQTADIKSSINKFLNKKEKKNRKIQLYLILSSFLLFLLAIIIIDRYLFYLWKSQQKIYNLTQKNETLLKAIPDIIMEIGINKVYTWANKSGYDFFGKDVIGRNISEFFEAAQETDKSIQPLFSGSEDTIYIENWQKRKDGEKRLLAWWSRSIKDKNNNIIGLLSTAKDITKQKEAEEALKESEQLFNNFMNHIPAAIFIKDHNFNNIFVNQYMKQKFNAQEWLQKNSYNIFAKETILH